MFDEILCYSIPLRTRFRGIDVREGMLLRRGDTWHEWSPFVEYGDDYASRWLGAAFDATPDPAPTRIPINVTVPVVDAQRAYRLVAESGCRTAKVKVADPGTSFDDDLARVSAVREALGDGQLRIDANGAWRVDEAFHRLTALEPYGLQYAEQPCSDAEQLAELRHRLTSAGIDVPIAADESIRRAEDPYRVAQLGAADVIVVKNQPLGGATACARIATEIGLPVVVSSALETSIGIWEGLRTAALLASDLACGLGTVSLLRDDVVATPLLSHDGYLEFGPRPSLDERAAARVAASPERAQWWRSRLQRCLAIWEESR